MKRIQTLAVLMLAVAGLVSCTQPGDQFVKSWKTTDVDVETVSGLPADTTNDLPAESYLNFYRGGRAVCYTRQGNYRMFDWEISADEQTIYLKRQSMALPNLQLKVHTVFPNYWSAKLPGLDSIRLFKYTTVFTHDDHDLLDPKHNSWRLKSDHRLSHNELQEKVRTHLQYAANYFELLGDREQRYFEPRFLNLPFNFYNGAFGLQSFATTKPSWQALFYDSKEARDALEIYRKATRGLSVEKKGKDLFEALHVATQQMAEHLK